MDEQMREKIRSDADLLIAEFYDSSDRNAWPDWAFAAVLTMEDLLEVIAALSQPAAQGDSSHPAGGEFGGVQVPLTAVQYSDRCECGRAYASCRICIEQMPRHKFWGAGEPDCPQDIKASNGELHTMRCKVCGDGWRKSTDVCFAAILAGQGGAA